MDKYSHEARDLDAQRKVHFRNIFAGSLSSSISRVFGQPFDVLKVRFQLQQMPHKISHHVVTQETEKEVIYRSYAEAIRHIHHVEGMRGFWRGHNVSQCQGFFQGIALFWTFEEIRPMLTQTALGPMPNLCNFLSGFLTGTVVVLTLSPLDVMRTHVIARKSNARLSYIKLAQELMQTGGVKMFFQGGYTAVLHVGSHIGCKFMFYNIFCDLGVLLLKHDSHARLPASVLVTAGAVAGFTSNLTTYPMELIKRRIQVSHKDKLEYGAGRNCISIVQCIKLVLHNEGFLGLYKGLMPCLIKSVVSTAVQFSAFDMLREWADHYF